MAGLSIRALLAVCSWALLGVTSAAVVGSVPRNDSAVKTSTPMSLSELTRVVQTLQISSRSLPELRREVQSLQRSFKTLPELTRVMQTLQKSIRTLPELRRLVLLLERSIGSLPDLTREVRTLQRTTIRGGATYVRWGRTSCPSVSELVYRGYVGGGKRTEPGYGVNNLCLPEDPQYANYSDHVFGYSTYLFGVEYENGNRIRNFDNKGQDVPCAVCRSPTRRTALMISGRKSCYPGFQLEYLGYLMAGDEYTKSSSENACVDYQPENVVGGEPNLDGKGFLFVQGTCSYTECEPFKPFYALSCVVCTK